MTDEVAVEQTVMERVASKFGFPSEEQVEAPAEALQTEESNLADLEWDGAVYQVPKSLKDGFMRNQDYTQKTQELASQRASLDQVRTLAEQRQLDAAFSDSIQTEQQELHVIDAYLAQAQKVDWSNMTTDQMVRTKHELDQIKERRESIRSAIADKRGKYNADLDVKRGELRTKAREIASQKIKGFSEETDKSIRASLSAEGFAEKEIDGILLDPRSYHLVWKAAQFDQISSKQAATNVDKVLKGAPPTERMPAQVVDKLNFKKAMNKAETSGEKANLIEQKLQRVFGRK